MSPRFVVEANFQVVWKVEGPYRIQKIPRPHTLYFGENGWEEAADYALTWSETKAGSRSVLLPRD